jgi:NAD(P)-dependent dehydrogenase (short-subunit alcohol dehydrogenase family)
MGALNGRVAIVTGAGRGIGREHALLLASEGAKVVINDLGGNVDGTGSDAGPAQEVVDEIKAMGGEAVANTDSVTDWEGGQRMINAAVEAFGDLHILVNNAGILRDRVLVNMTEAEWDAVIAVHLKGHFNLYRHASAVMRKQETGGSIVGFTSAAFVGSTAQANYSAAKGGIISLTRSAALSLHRYGVRANCIAPIAKTRMSENVPFEIETGEPSAVAPMAVYLISDAAKEITGQTYTVVGPRITVWNQPKELRSMFAPAGASEWTPEDIAQWLPKTIGVEEHPMLADLERRMAQMEAAKQQG